MEFINKVLEVLQFISVLSFLVVIHELGHYFSAKWSKVRVEEFGLGYPPRVKKLFTYGGTIFSLNWVPFGGFVKLEGEEGDGPSDAPAKGSPKEEGPFYEKSIPVRLYIILAGAFINFLFGIVAFSIYFSIKGIPTLLPTPRIGAVSENTPAAQAQLPTNVDIKGIRVNDKFTYTASVEEVIAAIDAHQGEHVVLITSGACEEVKCDSRLQEFEVYLRSKAETPANQGALGIRFQPVIEHVFYPWYEMPIRGAIYGTKQAIGLGYFIVLSLGDIVQGLMRGKVPADVAGPWGIFTQGSEAGFFSSGLLELLNFAGLLSVNLAIMNVLPIPALDGGRAFFILLELFVGKKKLAKIEQRANYGGFVVLITLIILITIKDISATVTKLELIHKIQQFFSL